MLLFIHLSGFTCRAFGRSDFIFLLFIATNWKFGIWWMEYIMWFCIKHWCIWSGVDFLGGRKKMKLENHIDKPFHKSLVLYIFNSQQNTSPKIPISLSSLKSLNSFMWKSCTFFTLNVFTFVKITLKMAFERIFVERIYIFSCQCALLHETFVHLFFRLAQ